MSEQELNQNEAATPYKLEQARKRGQVAKSADLVSAVVFGAAVLVLYGYGWTSVRDVMHFDRLLMIQGLADHEGGQALWRLVDQSLRQTLMFLMPLLGTIILAAIVGNLAQTGFNFTWQPLEPDLQRVNPMQGFKRIFSMRTLFDTLRTGIKLLILGVVVYGGLKALLPHFGQMASLPPWAMLHLLVTDVAALTGKLALALGVIAVIDFGYSHREFAKKMRMSRRELKDEGKHREGDPRIRARLRELRREMLKRTMALRKTRDADVVLTNPTHVAVALKYRHGEMDAPVVVGKGKGAMAAAVRKIAARHGIPVVQNPSLARALYAAADIDQQIPERLFTDVARIMVWVLAMRKAHAPAEMGARS
jgi:flagellar biosynthetic protein FlhB